jgi:hypothetical protein
MGKGMFPKFEIFEDCFTFPVKAMKRAFFLVNRSVKSLVLLSNMTYIQSRK